MLPVAFGNIVKLGLAQGKWHSSFVEPDFLKAVAESAEQVFIVEAYFLSEFIEALVVFFGVRPGLLSA